jgi:methylglutaconyl-CoA hydratase
MINYKVENFTAVISLNRPEKRNALNPELIRLIKENFTRANQDENVKSIILTGEGKAFCAGADLAYLKMLRENSAIENQEDSESLAGMFKQIYNSSKPVIAAVNGPAVAGGCGLVTVCDFAVADLKNSKFGYSEVKIGFVPAIVSIFLIRKIGTGAARRLLLTGEILNAGDAKEIGLVDYISEDVLTDSLNLAGKLNSNSLSSLIITKKMINDLSTLNINEAVEYSVSLNTISRSTEDFINGINSFLNKE